VQQFRVGNVHSDNGATLPVSSVKVLELERMELQQKLTDTEKRMLRLKEVLMKMLYTHYCLNLNDLNLFQVFASKIEEFRTAIAQLLGYRVDLGTDRVRLVSVFSGEHTHPASENQDAHALLFVRVREDTNGKSNESSLSWTLRRNAELSTVGDALEYYMDERQCVPAFLADWTLHEWESRTGGKRRST
jgi:hypothetical protein